MIAHKVRVKYKVPFTLSSSRRVLSSLHKYRVDFPGVEREEVARY